MARLFAFDVDGTLEISDGIVPLSALKKLKEKGDFVGIVGAFEKVQAQGLTELDFYLGGHPNKPKHLTEIKRKLRADEFVYVGNDEMDREAAIEAGFKFIPVRVIKPDELGKF